MHFKPESVSDFLKIFEGSQHKIQAFPGCISVTLIGGPEPTDYGTLSYWDSIDDLNAYRKSELFGRVWPKTKALFSAPPQTQTYTSISVLNG